MTSKYILEIHYLNQYPLIRTHLINYGERFTCFKNNMKIQGVYHMWRTMQVELGTRVPYMAHDVVKVLIIGGFTFAGIPNIITILQSQGDWGFSGAY